MRVEAADLVGPYLAHGQGWWLFGMLLELAVLASLVILGVVVVQRIIEGSARRPTEASGDRAGTSPDEALAELRLRYARGEISRDEYLQAAADLGSPVPTGAESPTG